MELKENNDLKGIEGVRENLRKNTGNFLLGPSSMKWSVPQHTKISQGITATWMMLIKTM